MRKSYFVAVFLFIALLLAAPPAPAGYNLLGNGSFETATVDPGRGNLCSLPESRPCSLDC